MIAKHLIVADRKTTARQEELCDFFHAQFMPISLSWPQDTTIAYTNVAADE